MCLLVLLEQVVDLPIPIPFLSFDLQEPCSSSLCLLLTRLKAEPAEAAALEAKLFSYSEARRVGIWGHSSTAYFLSRKRDSALWGYLPQTASLWEI